SRFVAGIADALDHTPERFCPIRGAPEMIQHLSAAGWHFAFATGGWGPSARMKLRAVGISANEAPFACADDATTRADIVRIAIARAAKHHGVVFERIVLLGDGAWDVSTARDLNLPF